MKNTKPVTTFAPYEIRRFISPLTVATIALLAAIVAEALFTPSPPNVLLMLIGLCGIAYLIAAHNLIVQSTFKFETYKLINAILSGFGLGIISFLLTKDTSETFHILVIFSIVSTATVAGRSFAYLSIALFLAISLPSNYPLFNGTEAILEYITPFFVSIIVLEVVIRIKDTTQGHIHRLETINKVSRQIMQTLDKEKTLALLDTTIQETLDADSYFIGIVQGEQIQFDLFYDDGEYFNGIRAPKDGTLSGWVIKNQRELYLPDMREEVKLDGVACFVMGKEQTSLSWIGVPLQAENVTGVLALASYTANAFDRADLELLVSLGQHVTLALDNAIRHAQVEKQAKLDSLTGVLNHGYFLKRLAEQAEDALRTSSPLSLIMLDIDFFKQYNDTYGHLVGDRILNSLCSAIQHNIKQTDSVGRWGGEEFIISLPGASGEQAYQIAKRISHTLGGLRVEDRDHMAIPIPTVSQGIAVFPQEADEIYRLIDVADKRLYVAKERGRNEVEPEANFWKQ